jgi:hypothetical protein
MLKSRCKGHSSVEGNQATEVNVETVAATSLDSEQRCRTNPILAGNAWEKVDAI